MIGCALVDRIEVFSSLDTKFHPIYSENTRHPIPNRKDR